MLNNNLINACKLSALLRECVLSSKLYLRDKDTLRQKYKFDTYSRELNSRSVDRKSNALRGVPPRTDCLLVAGGHPVQDVAVSAHGHSDEQTTVLRALR